MSNLIGEVVPRIKQVQVRGVTGAARPAPVSTAGLLYWGQVCSIKGSFSLSFMPSVCVNDGAVLRGDAHGVGGGEAVPGHRQRLHVDPAVAHLFVSAVARREPAIGSIVAPPGWPAPPPRSCCNTGSPAPHRTALHNVTQALVCPSTSSKHTCGSYHTSLPCSQFIWNKLHQHLVRLGQHTVSGQQCHTLARFCKGSIDSCKVHLRGIAVGRVAQEQ